MYPPIYPPAQEIQVVQPQYSAQHLGAPIAIGNKQNLFINRTQSQINLVEQLQLSLKILSEKNLPNPWMKIEPKFDQIDSASTNIRIGPIKSRLELNSQNFQTQLTLLSGSGFTLKMKGKLQTRNQEMTFGPVFHFTKSLNWFQELNSLTTSQFPGKSIFSLKTYLENLSAQLKFPVPGILSDELELKIRTNLPEVLVDGEDLQNKIKSTLSLRYGIAIDDATKLEIQNSYNLRTSFHRTFMRLILK